MNCPVCLIPVTAHTLRPEKDREDFDCPNCGNYSMVGSLLASLRAAPRDKRELAVLSHAIRRMQRDGERPLINTYIAKAIAEEGRLPNSSEQLENLILFLGKALPEPGAVIPHLKAPHMRAILGSISESAAGWLIGQAHALGLLEGNESKAISSRYVILNATLSLRGWEVYREMLAGGSQSKRAFMAMRFGDDQLDGVFRDHFKPAVKRAGFDLFRLDEEPKAGLIDDRLRLEIRRSRLLIADLSHGNAGAYWEAGYAEGLGRPVIYTCRRDVFDDPDKRPHFDTNHHLTIVWDPSNVSAAAEQLVTTIRVTLPADANLTDE
jgi:hypothetical protein